MDIPCKQYIILKQQQPESPLRYQTAVSTMQRLR